MNEMLISLNEQFIVLLKQANKHYANVRSYVCNKMTLNLYSYFNMKHLVAYAFVYFFHFILLHFYFEHGIA